MAAKHRIQTPRVINPKAHLYVRYADVACGLRPPCCTSCPRLPQVATATHQAKPPRIGQPTLSVEVAHNAMRNYTGASTPAITRSNQTNTGAPSWPSTI
jgi:hypothetical protein